MFRLIRDVLNEIKTNLASESRPRAPARIINVTKTNDDILSNSKYFFELKKKNASRKKQKLSAYMSI
jgi:hypothetical protein